MYYFFFLCVNPLVSSIAGESVLAMQVGICKCAGKRKEVCWNANPLPDMICTTDWFETMDNNTMGAAVDFVPFTLRVRSICCIIANCDFEDGTSYYFRLGDDSNEVTACVGTGEQFNAFSHKVCNCW